jgi:hypothetical protein
VVMAALPWVADGVCAVPHPDEPGEALDAWVGGGCCRRRRAWIWICRVGGDAAAPGGCGDRGHPRLASMDSSVAWWTPGVAGRVEPVRPPAPAFKYDANAHIPTDVAFLSRVDGRGLPPAFPTGFPVPAGAVLVIAQRATKDTWRHAGWRRSRPFTECPDRLRRFGCSLAQVAGADRLMRATGTTRELIRHAVGAGSVSLYRECGQGIASRARSVSVVWCPAAVARWTCWSEAPYERSWWCARTDPAP